LTCTTHNFLEEGRGERERRKEGKGRESPNLIISYSHNRWKRGGGKGGGEILTDPIFSLLLHSLLLLRTEG